MRCVVLVLSLVFGLGLAACGDDIKGNIAVNAANVPPEWQPALSEFVAFSDYRGLSLGGGDDDAHIHITLVSDSTLPVEGYRIDDAGTNRYTVSARDVLGIQYGLAAALEHVGFRFRHPYQTYAPREPRSRGGELGSVHQPETRVRGLQLHTLHPIEAYYAFWEPSPGNTQDAHRIIDWLIKNRGNYLHWVSLDNIMDPMVHEKWKPFTREIIDYAHMRGVRIGQNIQLFGSSNLQLAFDLSDDEEVPLATSIAERLPILMDGLPWDELHLSFGEFFGEEPQHVVDGINETAKQMREKWPGTAVHGFVHVGATQRVDYMGENLLYYFLLKFADPTVVPDIHTVMYFNLFDPAGGAYQHEEFNEHRDYLIQRMCAGQPHSYVPESGYWVAFDNSIPSYLPLYVYSRWRDIDGLRNVGCGKPLDNHTLFTTGWEWGYWLHDYANLRDVYEHATEPADLIEHAYAPDFSPDAIALIAQVMDEQKRALMDDRLSAYISSRDVIIDQGRRLDPPIISQPDRMQFDQVTDANVDDMANNVVAPLKTHADNLLALERKLLAAGVPDTRWGREVRDGFIINRLRAQFMYELYAGTVAHARGESATANYERAEKLIVEAQRIVTDRHSDLHDTHRRRLLDSPDDSGDVLPNATYYQYPYLYHADFLCFWHRELVQVGNVIGTSTATPLGCLFGKDRPKDRSN